MAKPATQPNQANHNAVKPKRENDQKMVMIVDDHPIICQGLAQLINQERDLKVCAQAHNAEDALEAIKDAKPDVVIADLSMGGFDGIRLVKMIKEQFAMLPVLVLSVHDESLYAERVLRAGA
jgi:DNA-binding NarL/FixJ family response regulator